MALTDLTLRELQAYRPELSIPADFDAFWSETLTAARAHDLAPVFDLVAGTGLATVDVYDVRFGGWAGERIAAWLVVPRHHNGAPGGPGLPAVVEFGGYSGGRGLPVDSLLYSAAGYVHLIVDSRGQGHDTPDPTSVDGGPQWVGGFMTRGITDRDHYYFRRLFTDCVRAVEAVGEHPLVDRARIIVAGGSQGGGMAVAAAGLAPGLVAGVLTDVPFLCHIRRGVDIATAGPYVELVEYLRNHTRDDPEKAFATLAYFDVAHHATRAAAPALFSVAMMDPICPASTVFAAYHHYGGAKAIDVWPFGDHRGGRGSQARNQLAWLGERGLSPR